VGIKFLAGVVLVLLPVLNDFYRGSQYDRSLSSGCWFALLGWAILPGFPGYRSAKNPKECFFC
jgi:hypothetical protein